MLPIDLVFLASCVYLPFLVLLYLAEIWTVVKPGSPFKNSFYILFVAGAIADLIMVISSFYELRLVFYPLVNGFFGDYSCNACSQIRVALSYICPFAQDLLNCFVALNRFTAIRLPVQHSRIWKRLLPLAISLSFLGSIATFGISFFRKASYEKIDLGTHVIYSTNEDNSFVPWYNPHRITSIEMMITSIIIILLYTFAARKLTLMRKLSRESVTVQQERKLFIFGIVNFLIMLPCMILQLIIDFRFFPPDWVIIMYQQFIWIVDVKCFSAAITMIIANSLFRKHMIKSFRGFNAVRSLSSSLESTGVQTTRFTF